MTIALARRNSTPGRHIYDAIVLGGQLSASLIAMTLAKRGLHVLLVEHDGAGASYVHGDWLLPHTPFLLPALKSIAGLEDLLTELGLHSAVHRVVHPQPLQVLRHKEWFELPLDPAARTEEVKRALGLDSKALLDMLAQTTEASALSEGFLHAKHDLPPEGLFAGWRFRRLLAKHPQLDTASPLSTTERGALLRQLSSFIAPVDGPRALTLTRTLGATLAAPHTITGGRETLHQIFLDRARELGVDVMGADVSLEAIAFEGSKPVGIRLARNDTIYRGAFLVSALELRTLIPLIPEARQRWAEKLASSVSAARAVFTWNVVLPERGLPPGLGPLALVETADPGLGAVLLQVAAARRADGDAAERMLSISLAAPLDTRKAGEPSVRALADRAWAALGEFLPFTRPHAIVESSPWIDAPAVVRGANEPAPLISLADDATLGVGALPVLSPYKRLLFAGREVLPGLGFEGDVLTCLRVARTVEHALHKNDPLKQRRAS